MIKSLILFTILVAAIYLIIRKFTVYRCPECSSSYVRELNGKNTGVTDRFYLCARCGAVFTKKSKKSRI